MGTREGDSIRCRYHGLKIGRDGMAEEMPLKHDAVPPRLCVETLAVAERHRFAWGALPVTEARLDRAPVLEIDAELATNWLTAFLYDELVERRGVTKAVLGLSGGVDSAVVAYLAARALGPHNVHAIRMPYRSSSPDSLGDAQAVIDALGCASHTIEITGAVDGYLQFEPDADPLHKSGK